MTPPHLFSALNENIFTVSTGRELDLSRNAFPGCCTPLAASGQGRHLLDHLALQTLALNQAHLWGPSLY